MDCVDISCLASCSKAHYKAAEKCFHTNKFGLALGNFLLVSKLNPSQCGRLEPSVIFCLEKAASHLEETARHQELLKIYESTLEVFPESGRILSELGEYLLRYGHTLQAAGYLQRALAAGGAPATARDSLDRACAALVDRWHFTMLNDRRRNEAFDAGIRAAVVALGPGDVVLDLGAGTGLLSIMVARAGASTVVACESSQTMSDVCAAVLADNGMSERVKLVNKSSLQLTVGEDLLKRASLLVTETFDAGLLGEHVLVSLDHAWRHLLLPHARVLPAGATVRACAVQSQQLRRHTSEPYDCERVCDLLGGYTCLTEPVEVYRVNFNNPAQVAAGLTGSSHSHVTRCTAGGRADAVVTWFELDLGNGQTLSSAPDADTCWEQAIYTVDDNVTLQAGDSVTFHVTCRGYLSVTLEKPEASTEPHPAGETNGCRAAPVAMETRREAVQFSADGCDWLRRQVDGWLGGRPVDQCAVLDLCPVPLLDGGEVQAGRSSTTGPPWDVVISWPVMNSGRLDPALVDTVQRADVSAGGLVTPRYLLLCAVPVNSQLVRLMTSVECCNTVGLDCSAINTLTVSHLQGFPYSCGRHTTDLSDVTCIGQLDLRSTATVEPAHFAILVTSSGVMDGLVFWFQPHDGSSERRPEPVGVHQRQMVCVQGRRRQVRPGDTVRGTIHRVSDGVFIVLDQ